MAQKLFEIFSACAKSHASEKRENTCILNFRILRIAIDVFFDADSESPHMT